LIKLKAWVLNNHKLYDQVKCEIKLEKLLFHKSHGYVTYVCVTNDKYPITPIGLGSADP